MGVPGNTGDPYRPPDRCPAEAVLIMKRYLFASNPDVTIKATLSDDALPFIDWGGVIDAKHIELYGDLLELRELRGLSFMELEQLIEQSTLGFKVSEMKASEVWW